MLRKILVLFLILLPLQSHAIINIGGYVPFGLSTQKDEDGGNNALSFKPMIGVNTVMPIQGFNHVFLPEIGIIPQGKEADEYKKSTLYFLLDVGYLLSSKLVLRYGIGTFLTKISGDGQPLELPNGTETSTFYRPKEGETSWNTTLNLGLEMAITPESAVRLESYMFSWLSSARKFSYSLSYVHYLGSGGGSL